MYCNDSKNNNNKYNTGCYCKAGHTLEIVQFMFEPQNFCFEFVEFFMSMWWNLFQGVETNLVVK